MGPGGAAKKPRREAAAAPQAIAGRADVPRDPWSTVVVKNLPWAAGEPEIVAFFAQAGKVRAAVRAAGAWGSLIHVGAGEIVPMVSGYWGWVRTAGG